MSRHAISLKSRVRYEGRAQDFDRRASIGNVDKLPDPMCRMIGMMLRSKFAGVTRSAGTSKPAKVA
jgi:hypothetical protein